MTFTTLNPRQMKSGFIVIRIEANSEWVELRRFELGMVIVAAGVVTVVVVFIIVKVGHYLTDVFVRWVIR